MSQNDKLLLDKGLPVLNKTKRDNLRGKWQNETWDDMILSLHHYNKYVMLRPTGFGKTYTCACACNIGEQPVIEQKLTREDAQKMSELLAHLSNGDIVLSDKETVINDKRIAKIKDKKVIFVYVSEILKKTFEEYDCTGKNPIIKSDKNGNSRIIFETYTSVGLHWDDPNYLLEELDLKNVGLIIFDEVQRMGAEKASKALDVAMKTIKKLKIPYIGATATVERATGVDVCDKYFTYKHDNGNLTYCWGEHIYTLNDAFKSGLIIPPEYQYIEDNDEIIKKTRHTRASVLKNMKAEAVATGNQALFDKSEELERAVIKNADKIVHDTMLSLYDCNPSYINNNEELDVVEMGSINKPEQLPEYMRFLVFAPDRKSLAQSRKDSDAGKAFGGIVKKTKQDFESAFGRYGYKVRCTVISSYNEAERKAVGLIDNTDAEEVKAIVAIEDRIRRSNKRKEKEERKDEIVNVVEEADVELGKAVLKQPMVIDLIFSINMLNVGYHVDNITGLIFKRWTASNQIYYQQLGRCLSSVSPYIPVVFDFVKSIDSKGITAPLYTRETTNKQVTENADGTHNTKYKEVKVNSKKTIIAENAYVMDADGNLVDPKKCNEIDAKYITVGMTSATIEEINERCKVYIVRKTAQDLFGKAYKRYLATYVTDKSGKKIINIIEDTPGKNILGCSSLESALRTEIHTTKNPLNNTDMTQNFKAFVEYLQEKEETVYIDYESLEQYLLTQKGVALSNKNNMSHMFPEINTLLMSAKTQDKKGTNLKIIVNTNKMADFKNNVEVKELLKNKLASVSDILVYSL